MKCIVGLGNPGKRYRNTRHNVGFMVIEELLHRHKWKLNKKKFNGQYTLEHVDGERVILLEPQTFMNLSGEAIKPLLDFYEVDVANVVVIYDDLDLPTGKIRLRQKGGHGGHNGIRSAIDHLGTKEFNRIRIGVGRPTTPIPVVDYVLAPFSKEQQENVTSGIKKAADASIAWLQNPFTEIMNEFNNQ